MSISFSCDECGKTFTLDDKFAGKKGKCKACGAVMQIPAAGAVEDVYGFEDAPLPPRAAPASLRDVEVGTAPAPPRTKKPRGLFDQPRASKSSGGHTAGSIGMRVVLGIVGAIAGLVATSMGFPGIRGMLDPNWTSRSRIETFIKRQVDLTDELTAILRPVTDIPGATAASSRANDTIHKLTKNLRDNKDRKGNQRDIDALKAKYAVAQAQAVQGFTGEITRLVMIPGVLDALAIQGSLNELAAMEQTIPGANQAQAGFVPPTPPRPHFVPPPPPDFGPRPGPRGRRVRPGPPDAG